MRHISEGRREEEMNYSFVIPGKVATKGRPRFSSVNGVPRTYTPKNTVEYENLVRIAWMNTGYPKLEGCIFVTITAIYPIPSSVSKKKKKELDGAWYPKKGDCDNIAKIILDSLNHIAYDDDAQIVSLLVAKKYGTEPKAYVTLSCD